MTLLCLRVWAKVDHSGGLDACWPWTASRNADGYGKISVGGRAGKTERAHRVVWELINGPIPPGLQVLHKCDNPPCCNPAHLFLGTNAENLADRDAKNRQPLGERRGHAKLTRATVLEIHRLYAADGLSQRALASRFKVAQVTIWTILKGRQWTHVL